MREPAPLPPPAPEEWRAEFGPASVIFGAGAAAETGEQARALGIQRALLVTRLASA